MGMKQRASRLIKKHGRFAHLLRPRPGTRDAYGGYIPGPDTAYPIRIITLSHVTDETFRGAAIMPVGDQRVLISMQGLCVTPATTDALRIDDKRHEVRSVTRFAPGGDVIFWDLLVRHV